MTQSAPAPDRLKQLQAQRESIEREIAEIRAALVLPLDAPLVDAQGFPRADVDLFRAREQRQRVIGTRFFVWKFDIKI